MLKNFAIAIAAVVVAGASARAGDLMDELEGASIDSIASAGVELEEFDLDGVDVDGLAANANGEETDAIEACFRRFGGFRHRGWGGWRGCYNYGFRSFGHCYGYYRPYYCHRPIVRCYTHYAPVISSYWGCY